MPEIQPGSTATSEAVVDITLAQLPQHVRKGDLILGRTTAPLIELCIKPMQHRILAQVRGRETRTDLTRIIQEVSLQSGYSWKRFGTLLETYQRQQTEKIQQFGNTQADLIRLNDQVAVVRVCYELFQVRDAAGLCRKIDKLFKSDRPDVTLSTIHRAKGLAADRVFVLDLNDMPLRWPSQQPWELEQERNIK